MRNFLSLDDVPNPGELVRSALALKQQPLAHRQLGAGKTLGLIFMNPSLRTRMSTQRAAYNLGMDVIVINVNQDSWQLEFEKGAVMDGTAAEHVKEAAGVISQYCDIVGIRTFAGLQDQESDYQEKILNRFSENFTVPVVSLESATLHPLQSLADVVTLEENRKSSKPKVVLSWAPHPKALPQAVANSFVQWVREFDYDLTITHPRGYDLASEFTAGIGVEYHQEEAFKDAHFVYAKNWSSYHQYGQVLSTDNSWTIDAHKMSLTNEAHFMHCLPVRRNVVATDEVIDNSLVIAQSNNRIYAAQAVLEAILREL